MSALPGGWASAALGDVVSKGRTDQQLIKGKLSTQSFDGSVPAYSASGQDVWCSEAGNSGPGIVLSAVGARCGKAFFADGEWTAIANTHALVPSPGISARFLWYLLNDENFWIKGGTAQPFVKVKVSLQSEIGVPPAAEQERILAAIEEQFSRLDAGVAGLERVRQNVTRLRAAVLRAAVQGTVVESDTKQWAQRSLGDVVTIASGQTPKGLEVADTGPTPYYKVGDMNSATGLFMAGSRAYIDPSAAERFGLHVRPVGTVIFPKRGGAIATNKKRVLSVPSAYDLNTIGLVPGPEISSRFLYLWISSIDLNTLADGSNVPQINHGDLSDLAISLPPKEEQARIVEVANTYLDQIHALDTVIGQAARRCDRLRASVLSSAFSGKLVPQDPGDEPASVLLGRIAAERASSNDHKPVKARRQRRARVTT